MKEHLTNMSEQDLPDFIEETNIPDSELWITEPRGTGYTEEYLAETGLVGVKKRDPETGELSHLTNMDSEDVGDFLKETSIPNELLEVGSPEGTGFSSEDLARKGIVGIARSRDQS